MTDNLQSIDVKQANCFYNYSIGLNVKQIDLDNTARILLSSKLTDSVLFHNLDVMFLDENNNITYEKINKNGRAWDNSWKLKFSDKFEKHVTPELIMLLNISFNESRITGHQSQPQKRFIRLSLPPIVLKKSDNLIALSVYAKIYSDGIIQLCFHLEPSLENSDEEKFIEDTVNIFKCYFDEIWIDKEIQLSDAESIISQKERIDKKHRSVAHREIAESIFNNHTEIASDTFEINGKTIELNKVFGSSVDPQWESNLDTCRSIYTNAIILQLAISSDNKGYNSIFAHQWQGRPSICLMRFDNQPSSKEELYKKFSNSLSRILSRSSFILNPPNLPRDLRPYNDYSFHGNRAVLLWTWLSNHGANIDAWEDKNTLITLLDHQARSELIEYHNMRIVRACHISNNPSNDNDLIYSYEALANSNSVIHQASHSGEIVDSIEYLLNSFGTLKLIETGKEQARWHLDQRRYLADKNKTKVDRWLSILFGVVGTAGLADLITKPLLKNLLPHLNEWETGLGGFILVIYVGFIIFVASRTIKKLI